MSESDLNRIMHGLVNDAVQLVEGTLGPDRQKATDYYLAKPFGNEEEGRSQVVISEVRDTVHGLLPSLMRIFFGPERVVEFVARTEQGIPSAEQATEYVQYVFAEENRGFQQLYNVLKDGLIRKIGVIKWWWDPGTRRAYSDDAMKQEDVLQLVGRDDVEPTKLTQNEDGTFKIEYTVATPGHPCIRSVPLEEFLYTPGARDDEDAVMLAHATKVRKGDLIAMGYDEKEIEEHAKPDPVRDTSVEAIARRDAEGGISSQEADAGEANDLIDYVEAYVRLDFDGDGEPELREVCMIGPEHYVVHNDPTDERPFAIFCPIPEPHTLIGQSEADLTMDLQLLKSSIARAMNDSLALSIYPRMVILENFVAVEDVLNTEIGAPIRSKKENAVTSINHPFTGQDALPVLEYFDGVSENRTGRDKGAMGLDADALQSTTSEGVVRALAASQEQIELIARICAEMTLKPLFRGIYRMLVKYKPAERLVKLRGQYVTINTATWESDLDVTVNVGLGTSLPEKRIQVLSGILEHQLQFIEQYGPGPENPITSIAQARNTLARLTELGGYKNVSEFWKPVDPNWAPPPAPPQVSPEQALAQAQLQVEQLRTQKDLEIKQAEFTLKQDQQEFDQELEIRKMANDFVLRRYQIDAQFKANFSQQQLQLDAAQEEAALDGAMQVARMNHEQDMAQREHALAANQQAHEQELARNQQAHEQDMAERELAQQASQQAATPQGTE